VDRAAVLREELAPVFDALRATHDEAEVLVARATSEAQDRRQGTSRAARQILAQANESLALERASAAAATEVETATLSAQFQAAAEEEVRRISVASEQKVAPVVEELVRTLLSDAGLARSPS
jgi:F0F1-type ATP synthase membrane subunit b/b'